MRINRVIISKNTYGEYVCRMYHDKTRISEADYYALDKQDAYHTAIAVLETGKGENQTIIVERNGLAFYIKDN